jgi:ceramide glucosyltransferase
MIWLVGALVAGAVVYCFLVLIATYQYQAVPAAAAKSAPPFSILKPLKGVDLGLRENLETFFTQQYPGEFEIVFAVADAADPALAVVEELRARFPQVPARALVVGPPEWNNAKVWSLDRLLREARHDLLLMADSDIRVGPDLLATLASEFAADPKLGVATCPYRAVGGPSLWSELEALGMNSEFLAGVLVARMLEGMRFTLGPTVAARKQAIEAVGGWAAFRDYLAEDFVLGQRVTAAGWNSILSRYVVEHRIGSEPLAKNFAHRLRWNRSTRRSRPAGYVGQLFTNPIPLFLIAWPWTGWAPGFLAAGLLLRYTVAFATAQGVLSAAFRFGDLWKLPLQDLLSFGFWLAGFFGKHIEWRGQRYELQSDGTFRPATRS